MESVIMTNVKFMQWKNRLEILRTTVQGKPIV